MIPVLFPLLTCIMSTENLLNWTNLCPPMDGDSQTDLFLLMGKLYESHVRNLLSVCGLQDHQLGNLKGTLSHLLSSGHSSAKENINQSLHIQAPSLLDPVIIWAMCALAEQFLPLREYVPKMGYDTIN